ncbi:glycerophosphodiester phosphodiesterase family protein [Hyella patelloides]|uniref:glycerophosphodiester phosphodiesterase family protein n=1 Tax=Hyella patelloides TaxID=1982969 RepID=UPI001C97CC88|nr:glycerophosphodiester phosphodiesterase family protein [Hyella patelloides]
MRNGITPNIPQLNTLNGQDPIIIAHRGASGSLPENTLAGFRLALEQGADFIEIDYVMTKDGVPIVRHEPLLNKTTNILDRPEFSDRKTTKIIDGVEVTGFFAEDFILKEIKTLRARQPRPERSDEFDDLYEIPTMAEVIRLVKDFAVETNQQVGIVHELKHNSYFDSIGLNVEEAVARVLIEEEFTNPEQNIIQTFEIAPLICLDREIMPEAGIDLPLHQLTGAATEDCSPGFSFPYDIVDNFSNPDFTPEDARAVYGDLVDIIDLDAETGYGDLLVLPEFYQFVSTYAEAINPWKNTILLRESLEEPFDGDGDGNTEIRTQLTGEVFSLIELAHDAGLLVHVYTLRDEERYLTLNPDSTVQTPEQEAEDLFRLGADGLIGDFPETINLVRDRSFS